MILALILACVVVLFLLVTVLILSLKLIDCAAVNRTVTESLRKQEELYCRAQSLIRKKFNYGLPVSDKYFSVEEILIEKEAKEE